MELRAAARTKDDTPGITELIYRRALSSVFVVKGCLTSAVTAIQHDELLPSAENQSPPDVSGEPEQPQLGLQSDKAMGLT